MFDAVLLVGGDVTRHRQACVEAQVGDRSEGRRFDLSLEVEAAHDPTFVTGVADPGDRAGRWDVGRGVLYLQRHGLLSSSVMRRSRSPGSS